MSSHPPPFYVLLAHSPLSNVPSGALSNTLAHPVVQYHYADDSPLAILPTHPDESVLILDYDSGSTHPVARSISDRLATTGLSVEEAPGAAADDSNLQMNKSMFVIETTTNDHLVLTPHPDKKALQLQATLAQFKHRNKMLRRVLEYPDMGLSQGIQISETGTEPPLDQP